MDITSTITIVGSILGALMALNAFFIKSLVSSINELNLKMTTVTIQHGHTVIDVKDMKLRITAQEQEILKLRDRVHSLEGGQKQLISYLEESEK